AARYTRWLHAQEAQGWSFEAAEVRVDPRAVGSDGLVLHGRIDRVDVRAGTGVVRLIDYKTNLRKSLEDKVRSPLEDTQLAAYAALQRARQPDAPGIEACYVALDDTDAVSAVAHPHVEGSARVLAREVAAERARIDAGAALPALGEGAVCETCEARGLCRRDHWSDGNEGVPGAA
ncbi:MAG TPA: PD-(D/E)XK nuclease family protein, partial [Burkholderiaceae bacterium]|nr:PD-(D/E)XK nuclease family protein [Burkholderiaceae bacterium]